MKALWTILFLVNAVADTGHQHRVGSGRKEPPSPQVVAAAMASQHRELLNLISRRKSNVFVQAGGLKVVKLLPDDREGRPHQKFVVELADGKLMTAIYNLDMCPRVPVAVGDIVGLAGDFIWSQQRPIMHWLHHDPSGKRPTGFVELEGRRYCDK
jgi:hypothetical protein